MQKVMNNYDIRREIWGFLRKEPKKICFKCKSVLIWDKKVKNYYTFPKYYQHENISICHECVPTFNLPTCNLI